jgi:hypothetical protein
LQRLQNATVFVVSGGRFHEIRRNSGNENRFSGSDDFVGSPGRIRIGRVAFLECPREFNFCRIDMSHGEPLQRATLADDINGTPVGHARHRQLCEGFQCPFVIEGGAEGGSRSGEECSSFSRVIGSLARQALLFVQLCCRECRGDEVCQRGADADVGVLVSTRPMRVEDHRPRAFLPNDEREHDHGGDVF